MRSWSNELKLKAIKVLWAAMLGIGGAASAPAHAGEWRIMGVQRIPMAPQPDRVFNTEVAEGTITTKIEGQPDYQALLSDRAGEYGYNDPSVSWGISTGSVSFQLDRKSESYTIDGKARVIFQWQRWGETPEEKAADNPPNFLYFTISAGASAWASSSTSGSNRDLEKEHVSASVEGATEEPVFNATGKEVRAVAPTRLIKWPAGADRVEGPWCSLKASAAIDGNRFVRTDTSAGPKTGEEDLQGDISAGAGYSAALDISFSPDPNGLAVMDCPPSNKPLNQYVITDGIPCVVHYGGTDGSFIQRLQDTADWTLARPPLPLLPRGPNGSNNNGDVFYQTEELITGQSGDPPTTVQSPKMKFDLSNGLPLFNSDFGRNTITHTVLGKTITAPIAIFYPSKETNHPDGGQPGWYMVGTAHVYQIPTPNWFYYYAGAYALRWPVQYVAGGNFYYPGDDHIHIGDGNGLWTTYLFAKVPDGAGGFVLRPVGSEETRGIDKFARVATHEYTHKMCYERINNGLSVDTDGDRVPDSWETSVGLTVGNTDSMRFTFNNPELEYSEGSGDSEVFARMHERGIEGDVEADWASDGLNMAFLPPNRCQRLVPYLDQQYGSSETWQWPTMPAESQP